MVFALCTGVSSKHPFHLHKVVSWVGRVPFKGYIEGQFLVNEVFNCSYEIVWQFIRSFLRLFFFRFPPVLFTFEVPPTLVYIGPPGSASLCLHCVSFVILSHRKDRASQRVCLLAFFGVNGWCFRKGSLEGSPNRPSVHRSFSFIQSSEAIGRKGSLRVFFPESGREGFFQKKRCH